MNPNYIVANPENIVIEKDGYRRTYRWQSNTKSRTVEEYKHQYHRDDDKEFVFGPLKECAVPKAAMNQMGYFHAAYILVSEEPLPITVTYYLCVKAVA